jgi:hypothetical protein
MLIHTDSQEASGGTANSFFTSTRSCLRLSIGNVYILHLSAYTLTEWRSTRSQRKGRMNLGPSLTYIHTHIQTYIHTYIHTYIDIYIHTYVRTYTRTYIHTHIRTYIHTYTHTYIHTHIYIHTYIHTHTYIPTEVFDIFFYRMSWFEQNCF